MAVRGTGAAVVAGVVVARTHQLCNNQRCDNGMELTLDFRFLAGTCCSSLSAQLISLRAHTMVPSSLLVVWNYQFCIGIVLQCSPAF